MVFPTDNLHRILFLDIETATLYPDLDSIKEDLRAHWYKKFDRYAVRHQGDEQDSVSAESYFQDKAAIFAEYAKVVCISVGYIKKGESSYEFRTKTFKQRNELDLLNQFCELLNEYYYDRFNHYLCGHNIKEFDIPFLCRRMIINQVSLPNLLNIAGLKPWQANHLLDTMDLWKYGDYKHYTSLDLLCTVLKIDSPKSDISGKDVSRLYWKGKINDIAKYCEGDVRATIEVYLRCMGLTDYQG